LLDECVKYPGHIRFPIGDLEFLDELARSPCWTLAVLESFQDQDSQLSIRKFLAFGIGRVEWGSGFILLCFLHSFHK
jgi:hypothetical protein